MTKDEQRRLWREEEAAQIEATKADLSMRHGLERNRKFDIAWNLAWEQGHSSGFDEVEMYFNDLVPLLKP